MPRVLPPAPKHVSTAVPVAAECPTVRWPATLKGPLAPYADAIYPPRRSHALPPPPRCPPIICEYGALVSDDGRRPRHEPHNGIDIGAAAGTAVIAAAPGTVASAATQAQGGHAVVLYHGADHAIVSPHLFALTETIHGVIRWRAWFGEIADDAYTGFSGFTYPAPIKHSA